MNKVKESKVAVSNLYPSPNVGTEEMNQEDVNTPTLKILQAGTQDVEDKKDGNYYRTDTKEQMESVGVNLIYVTTAEGENYNKTAMEKFKIYFGYYMGTTEPFKMFVRGWGLASHREFQTELAQIKHKYNLPMLALSINLKSEKKTGTIQSTGKGYTIYVPRFEILKDTTGEPIIEQDKDRVEFLIKSAYRFAEISTPSENDIAQNEVDTEDIPS